MINDLKELEKLLKLCRKQGVTEIDLGSVKFKLGDLPAKLSNDLPVDLADDEQDGQWADFPQGILTSEQLAHYANGGTPEMDPALVGT